MVLSLYSVRVSRRVTSFSVQTSHFHGKIRSSLKGPLLDDIEVAKYKRYV